MMLLSRWKYAVDGYRTTVPLGIWEGGTLLAGQTDVNKQRVVVNPGVLRANSITTLSAHANEISCVPMSLLWIAYMAT